MRNHIPQQNYDEWSWLVWTLAVVLVVVLVAAWRAGRTPSGGSKGLPGRTIWFSEDEDGVFVKERYIFQGKRKGRRVTEDRENRGQRCPSSRCIDCSREAACNSVKSEPQKASGSTDTPTFPGRSDTLCPGRPRRRTQEPPSFGGDSRSETEEERSEYESNHERQS